MDKILQLLNKYGILIIIIIGLILMIDTCGTKSVNEKNGKKVDRLEKTILKQDSILNTKTSKEQLDFLLQINALDIEREVVYTNNAIVRTSERPDDAINRYAKLKQDLQEKLKNAK